MRRTAFKAVTSSDDGVSPVVAEEGKPGGGPTKPFGPIALVIVLYVLTGMMQPTLVDVLKYRGAVGASIAMLPMLGKKEGGGAWAESQRSG